MKCLWSEAKFYCCCFMNLELNFAHRKTHYFQFILSINRQFFFRKVVGSVEKRACMDCPSKHQMKYYKVVPSTTPKLRKLMTSTEICYLFEKRSEFAIIYWNSDLLVNTMHSQCPIFGSLVWLWHNPYDWTRARHARPFARSG